MPKFNLFFFLKGLDGKDWTLNYLSIETLILCQTINYSKNLNCYVIVTWVVYVIWKDSWEKYNLSFTGMALQYSTVKYLPRPWSGVVHVFY